jgi:hypothetical protein
MTDHATPDRQRWVATEQPNKRRENIMRNGEPRPTNIHKLPPGIYQLIIDLENASFACGDYNEEGPYAYEYYYKQAESAKKALVEAIKNLGDK